MRRKTIHISLGLAVAAALTCSGASVAMAAPEPAATLHSSQGTLAQDVEAPSTIVAQGQTGDVAWTLDDVGALRISGGTASSIMDWNAYEQQIRSVSFTGMSADGQTPQKTVFPAAGIKLIGWHLVFAKSLDMTNVDTSNVTSMAEMFGHLLNLEELVLPETFETAQVTDMDAMFSTTEKLREIVLPDSFVTDRVTRMGGMFMNNGALERIVFPAEFDTSNVTDMSYMFFGLRAMEHLDFPSGFDTQNVTDMRRMFEQMTSIEQLDLPVGFKTSRVENMSAMFAFTSKLQKLILPETFDTSSVTDMHAMFAWLKTEYPVADRPVLRELVLPDAFVSSPDVDMGGVFAYQEDLEKLVFGPGLRLNDDVFLEDIAADDEVTGNWVPIVPGTESAPQGVGPGLASSALVTASQQEGWSGGTFVREAFNGVVLHDQDAGAEPIEISGVTGAPITLPTPGEAARGVADRTFVEWNTEADGSGVGYQASEPSYFPAGTTSLYAQWEESSGETDPGTKPQPEPATPKPTPGDGVAPGASTTANAGLANTGDTGLHAGYLAALAAALLVAGGMLVGLRRNH